MLKGKIGEIVAKQITKEIRPFPPKPESGCAVIIGMMTAIVGVLALIVKVII